MIFIRWTFRLFSESNVSNNMRGLWKVRSNLEAAKILSNSTSISPDRYIKNVVLPRSRLVRESLWWSSSSSSISGSTMWHLSSGTLKYDILNIKIKGKGKKYLFLNQWLVFTESGRSQITYVSTLTTWILLYFISGSSICLLLEMDGSLGVGDGTVLFVPIIIFHEWRNSVGVHQDVTTQERCLKFTN